MRLAAFLAATAGALPAGGVLHQFGLDASGDIVWAAGAVIAVMLATGRALESYALRRAKRGLTALQERAPRLARRYVDGLPQVVGVDEVRKGDLLLVPSGEIVPVDGMVARGPAVLDESALTGEALPVERGTKVPAGSATRL